MMQIFKSHSKDDSLTIADQRHRSVDLLYFLLHLLMLGLSIFLIVSISIDSFRGEIFYGQPRFMKTQFWICIVFMADFLIELQMSKRKLHYFFANFIFLLVSIPYLQIIHYFGWTFSVNVTYMMQFIPLVRGGYAMAIIVGWFAYNKATGLFVTYVVTLLATVYFASLVFFMYEHSVNPLVKDYSDALWWASMDVTTVGSNIDAVTTVGRILSVVLAALGMMMFPIFTVYITSLIMSNRTAVINQINRHMFQKRPTESHNGNTGVQNTP